MKNDLDTSATHQQMVSHLATFITKATVVQHLAAQRLETHWLTLTILSLALAAQLSHLEMWHLGILNEIGDSYGYSVS